MTGISRESQDTTRATGLSTVTEATRAAGLHHAMYVLPILRFLVAVVLFLAFRAADQSVKSGAEFEWGCARRIAEAHGPLFEPGPQPSQHRLPDEFSESG